MNSVFHAVPRAAQRLSRLACLLLVPLGLATLNGCNGSDAFANVTKGSLPTAWGPSYPNMPDIVRPNVRNAEYAAVSDVDAPPIDPAKGYRIQSLGGGVHIGRKSP